MKKVSSALVLAIALALAACGGSPEQSAPAPADPAPVEAESTETTAETSDPGEPEPEPADVPADTPSDTSEDPKEAYIAAGYLDANGNMTAKAFVELDGAGLADVAEVAGYTWNDNYWERRFASDAYLTKGLTEEEMFADGNANLDAFDFAQEEALALAAGAVGTPAQFSVYYYFPKSTDAAEVLSRQQLNIIDQCNIDTRYYGIEIWALVEGPYGRYLVEAQHAASNDRGYIAVYTPEYIAINANGVASRLDEFYYELENVHDLDEAWQVIKDHAVE